MTRWRSFGALVLACGLSLRPYPVGAQGYSGPSAGGGDAPQKQLEALQERIESEPETMDAIRALQSDPAFQEVLSDPEITRAVAAGDLSALLANPKIDALGKNPTVQEITKKLGK